MTTHDKVGIGLAICLLILTSGIIFGVLNLNGFENKTQTSSPDINRTRPSQAVPVLEEEFGQYEKVCPGICVEEHVIYMTAYPGPIKIGAVIAPVDAEVKDNLAHWPDLFMMRADISLFNEVLSRCEDLREVDYCVVNEWITFDYKGE